jgi:N-acetylglutamate synthase-like GNAT family acetyltransferase
MTVATAMTDVVVRDGSTVCMRQADEGDVPALLQFLQALSPQSLYYRFHGRPALTESRVRTLVGADGSPATTLVAESGGRIIAFAGYHRDSQARHRAEVAFAVSDAVQGHGIGTRLLEQLAKIARDVGITTFDAYVLGENRHMLEVFRNSGFTETVSVERGVCHVTVSLALTDDFAERAATRSQIAATASMRAFFEPRVVAVVGANRTRGKIGSEILNNLLVAGFTGTIVPVHPTATTIAGLTT